MAARRPRVFDQRGRYLGVVTDASGIESEGWGASFWEILHPFTVQKEYEAVGKEAPPVSEIVGDAMQNIEAHATDAASSFINTGKWLLIAAAGVALLMIYSRVKR